MVTIGAGRADHVGAAHGLHQSFYAVSHPPFSDELDEALLLELSDMVVHLLPRHPDAARQARSRIGLSKLAEYLAPKRMKSGRRWPPFDDDMHSCVHTES